MISWLKGTNIDVSPLHLQHLSAFVSVELFPPVFFSVASIWQMHWDLFWRYGFNPHILDVYAYSRINTVLFVSLQLRFYLACICVCSRGCLCTESERERSLFENYCSMHWGRWLHVVWASKRTLAAPRVSSVVLLEITEYGEREGGKGGGVGGGAGNCKFFSLKIFFCVLSSFRNQGEVFALVNAPRACCCTLHQRSRSNMAFSKGWPGAQTTSTA